MQQLITCSMCGHTFNPENHATCQACPLKKNCDLVCCPECGFEMVDIHQSVLVRLFNRLFPRYNRELTGNVPNLAKIIPGQQVKVIGFTGMIPAHRQAHLQSYGLVPGRVVQVLQHSPVTIVLVEHTEIALENDMAKEIQVENP